ncbi:peptidoglycan-associated lipoprotein Pal [Oryzomonas rubra]|uniref:Peptidoglycan-associated lipoprotein n=1 Tax=Oryzomonas rubra TaxID=2509454 RepID=A0A5A9XFA0_9BACT|nr:peptidoglycan-associated lipoprotein Pal [Oryzomonas rubra]KAA0891837.1 peptidoglycan-associated lipoprotein Pal [Oryzomonas rubra]
MKRGTMVVLAALSLAALLASGCANKEVVKSEEPVVRAEQPKAPEVAKPEVAPAPTKQAQPEQATPAAEPIKQAEAPVAAAPAAETAFESVYFDFDKSDLSQDARDVLSKNADILLKNKPGIKVQIAGHCDERGSAEYNLALGERRAKSALHYLTTLGVAADRLSIISYGKEKPAVDGHDEAAWAKNRRDEFVIVQ